jgi:hypothetical protein
MQKRPGSELGLALENRLKESLIFSLCERSRILSLIEELVRHQAVERSAPLGLDPLEWKGRQSLLQPLPHNGHDALQAPLRPEG